MPFYDLHCPSCDKEHYIQASVKEKTEKLIPCPDCGSFELESVFKRAAYIKNMKSPDCAGSSFCAGAGGCRHTG